MSGKNNLVHFRFSFCNESPPLIHSALPLLLWMAEFLIVPFATFPCILLVYLTWNHFMHNKYLKYGSTAVIFE